MQLGNKAAHARGTAGSSGRARSALASFTARQSAPFRSCGPVASSGASIGGPISCAPSRAGLRAAASAVPCDAAVTPSHAGSCGQRPLKVVIAGAGIGGLVLALSLIKKGVQVEVYERDLTAIRGEGKYRGPIQVQSNALAALEAIDEQAAHKVMAAGCITGDRINGLCDGVSGDWYVKFDTFHPAVDRGLPVTRVVSRVTLQQILAERIAELAGPDIIVGNSHVVGFEEARDARTGEPTVHVRMEDGRMVTGDLLIGADGIWSKIRKEIVGETPVHFSGYTCYTGISDFTPADIELVGYRVFLGNGQYFVSSDVGGGKMQWYGFHKEAAGGSDPEGGRKARLLDIFGHWNHNVVDLVKATPEADILRRDIYDRAPVFRWSRGRVALLGDSAHAMQPNLGQGGCMAIEDAFKLAGDLAGAVEQAGGVPAAVDVPAVLSAYHGSRNLRVSAIHGMAGMAAFMASTYKAYLGEGLGPLSGLTALKILHPGRVAGQLAMKLTMPGVLQWVLGGNIGNIEGARTSQCLLGDKPKAFAESDFARFLADDAALAHAAHADWLLLAERPSTQPGADVTSTVEAKGLCIGEQPAFIGRPDASSSASAATSSSQQQQQGPHLAVEDAAAEQVHAKVWREPAAGTYHLQALAAGAGTWHNGRRLAPGQAVQLMPADVLEFGASPSAELFVVKQRHVSLRHAGLSGEHYATLLVGRRPEGAEGLDPADGAGAMQQGSMVAAMARR